MNLRWLFWRMTMINVAIVDDEQSAYQVLSDALSRFSKENGVTFNIAHYQNAIDFLEEYRPVDLVLMDVEMPLIDGLTAAEKLRKIDEHVALIFITNMAQYAIRGYAVDAIDYVLKPVNYMRFAALMKKTLRIIGKNIDKEITVKTAYGVRLIYVSAIIYIEISGHLLYYYTEKERIETWGTLKEAEKALADSNFVRCNHSCVVNLKYVEAVDKNTITLKVANKKISVSTNKKNDFMKKLNQFWGQ